MHDTIFQKFLVPKYFIISLSIELHLLRPGYFHETVIKTVHKTIQSGLVCDNSPKYKIARHGLQKCRIYLNNYEVITSFPTKIDNFEKLGAPVLKRVGVWWLFAAKICHNIIALK